MTLWPFSTKPCPRTIRLEALGIPLTQRPSWVSSNIFIGKNSTNPSLFTTLIPRVPESDKRSIEGEILLAVNSQFPRDMGAGAMRAAIKAVNGEKIDQYVQLTPTKLYTSVDRLAIEKWLSEH